MLLLLLRVEGRGIDGPPSASASLHRLRRRTVLRRTVDPSPSSVCSGAEHRPLGLGGHWRVGGSALLLGFAVGLLLPEDYCLPLLYVLGNSLTPSAHPSWPSGLPEGCGGMMGILVPPRPLSPESGRGPQPCQREEGFTVPRRTVCGEAVERSAGRSGIVNPSSTVLQ